MTPPLHVVILAAGQGTRMRSRLPKVLHPLAGKPLLAHVIDCARALGAQTCHVVHGHGAEQVRAALAGNDADLRWVMQAEQKGTAHAVSQALPGIPDDAEVLVLYGDVPLIGPETLRPLLGGKGLTLLTAQLERPHGYGRILRRSRKVVGIVEEKDATPAQRRITEVNTGIVAAPARRLKRWLPRIGNRNANGEYYLTDAVAVAVKDGAEVRAIVATDVLETLGVNDPAQLAQLERVHQRRTAERLMRDGVQIRDPARFDLRGTLRCAGDVVLDVGVVIEGKVVLEAGVHVGPYVLLRDTQLGPGTRVEPHSVLDGVIAGRDCRIGPFARLRPQTVLADHVHIGNFVEAKKTTVGEGSKANHLAYLGDGAVGARVNIGAGTIFCNYDGAHKHVTVLEDDVFVGSDTQLVAPVTVRKGATIGAGSTITKEVPSGGLTVCRAKDQKTYASWQRPVRKPR